MWVPNNPIERLWCWKRTGEGLLSTSFEINDYQRELTPGAQKQLASYNEVRVSSWSTASSIGEALGQGFS
jgi:hypothetical protein